MKVYVDELPENCKKCPYFIEGGFLCRMNDCKMLDMVGGNSVWNGRDKDCPLQSLADYTKQVRNEVCDEIRNKFSQVADYQTGINDEWEITISEDLFLEILNKAQGETK